MEHRKEGGERREQGQALTTIIPEATPSPHSQLSDKRAGFQWPLVQHACSAMGTRSPMRRCVV